MSAQYIQLLTINEPQCFCYSMGLPGGSLGPVQSRCSQRVIEDQGREQSTLGPLPAGPTASGSPHDVD